MMDIKISLATEADLESMRVLRNQNRTAYFFTDEVSPEGQRNWWAFRDRSVRYFVGRAKCKACDGMRVKYYRDGEAWEEGDCRTCYGRGSRHVWQFSLSADGVLGNLAVADWAKGQGVAKHCVARVLVPGQRYWGLFRVDNPTILRFWPSMGFPEPTYDPPPGKDWAGHPPGTVQWVDYVWTEEDVKRHGVVPWFLEEARKHRLVPGSDFSHKVAHLGSEYEAAAHLSGWHVEGGWVKGQPPRVVEALKVLYRHRNETLLDYCLRVKRSNNEIAKAVKVAELECAKQDDLVRMAWHILERT
jgi:hypothetical protein